MADDHYLHVADTAVLRDMYKVLSDSRIDYNVRKWDTIRTAALFALGVLAAVGGLLTRTAVPSVAYFIAAGVLVLMAGVLWWWVRTSVTREAGLQYSVEFSMYQIEKLLGLHRRLRDEDRWLPDHEYIVSEKNLHYTFRTVDGSEAGPYTLAWWLDAKKARQSFLRTIDILFGAFLTAAVGFGVVLLLLGLKVV
jgi:hypothetical protein